MSDDDVIKGYDIGPGNCLLDAWVQKHRHVSYDTDGAWAATGEVIESLLSAFLDDSYFKRLAPKSLGKEYFSDTWLAHYLSPTYTAKDVQATLVALTATTISQDINQQNLNFKRVAICGGGIHNTTLLNTLRQQLPSLYVESTAVLGVDPDFMEAMMFAWLADKALNQTPLDFSSITGAKKLAIFDK